MAQAHTQNSRFGVFKRLLPLYVVIVIGPLNTSGAFNLVPVFSDDFAISLSLAGLAITFYMLPFVVSQVFSGSVAELLGPSRALIAGFLLFSASCFVAAAVPTYAAFLLARAVQGLGGGIILPVSMAMVAGQVPSNRTATAIGGLQSAFALGVALGPGVAGLFAEQLHWRGFYVFLAVSGVIAAGLIAVAYSGGRQGETGRRNPLRPLQQALAVGGIRSLSLMSVLLSFASVGVAIFVAVWLQTSGLAGPARAGLLLSIPGIVGIVVAPLAGYLGDRWGAVRTIMLGMGLTLVGIAGLFVAPGVLLLYPLFFLFTGMGNISTRTNLGATAMMNWPDWRQTVAGLVTGSGFLGLALAPLLLTPVYEATSLRGVLLVSGGVLLATLLLLRAIRRNA